MELLIEHGNAHCVCNRSYFLICGFHHGCRAEIDYLADLVFAKAGHESTYFGSDRESVVGVAEEKDINFLAYGRINREGLNAQFFCDGFRKALCVTGLCKVSDCKCHYPVSLIIQEFLDGTFQCFGFFLRRKSLRHLTILIYKELGKVPFYAPGLLLLKILVDRSSIVAVHFDLLKAAETGIVLKGAEAVDLLGTSGRLERKLIAGEVEDLKSPVSVFLVEFL